MIKNQFFWIAATLSLVADQLSKYWVITNLPIEYTKPVTLIPDVLDFDPVTGHWLAIDRFDQSRPLISGVLHFTHVVNPGAAFSLFPGEGWLRWLSLAVSLFLIGLAIIGPKLDKFEQIAYGLVLAGALGNGIERFALGYVTDFIDLRFIRFAIFNWADVSINLGIVAYLAHVITSSRRSS